MPPAIEEEGDVRVLLRLGHMQLGQPRAADHFPEGVRQAGRGKGDREILELLVVERQDAERQVAHGSPGEAAPVLFDEGFRELHFALPAAAAEDDGIAVLHPPHGMAVGAQQHDRLKGVVGLARPVAGAHGLGQRQGARFGAVMGHGLPRALPGVGTPAVRPCARPTRAGRWCGRSPALEGRLDAASLARRSSQRGIVDRQ